MTRSGSTLYLNGQPFRFGGTNLAWIGSYDSHTPPTHTQTDTAFSAVNSMHETVVRGMSMGIQLGYSSSIEPALNQFNDAAFESDDYAIKVAASYHIHLIIPLTQYWNFPHGGLWTFLKWRGSSNRQDFFTNPTIIQDYENYISHILNHVNQYTGIAYKADATIMMWETGNEMNSGTYTWSETIAKYIKSVSPHQLVSDGMQFNYGGSNPAQLQSPDIDAVSDHGYPITSNVIQNDAVKTKAAGKVFWIGEYDATQPTSLPPILAAIENNCAVSGDTFWQLYPPGASGDKYTLHYPGDNATMQQSIQLLSAHAVKMSSSTSCGGTGSPPTIPQSTLPPTVSVVPTPTLFGITPKFHCIGSCPTLTQSPVVSSNPTTSQPIQPQPSMNANNPLPSAIQASSSPPPAVQPQPSGRRHNSRGIQVLLQQLLNLIKQLLALLASLLGKK